MKNILLMAALAAILLASLVRADSSRYDVSAEIFNNNTVHYKLVVVFSNITSQNVTIPIGLPSNIRVDSTECEAMNGNLGTVVLCTLKSDNTSIIIEYDSDDVKMQSGYYLFSNSFKILNSTKAISVLVKLPEGSGLREPTEKSYSPTGALIGSDGRRPIINWVVSDPSSDRFDISIAFERIMENVFPFGIALALIIILFSGLGLFYQFYWRGKGVSLIMPVLKKDEKMIFNAIMKNGSGINQKVIVRESGYSKAKVSKVLKSLQERGLIKLERVGRTNKVHIAKNFENKP